MSPDRPLPDLPDDLRQRAVIWCARHRKPVDYFAGWRPAAVAAVVDWREPSDADESDQFGQMMRRQHAAAAADFAARLADAMADLIDPDRDPGT